MKIIICFTAYANTDRINRHMTSVVYSEIGWRQQFTWRTCWSVP